MQRRKFHWKETDWHPLLYVCHLENKAGLDVRFVELDDVSSADGRSLRAVLTGEKITGFHEERGFNQCLQRLWVALGRICK